MAVSRRSAAARAHAPVRYGCEVARIFTPPLRPLTPETSLGFSVIAFAELLGVELLSWQRWFLIHALELLPSGRLRFRTVVLLVGRQNGKSTVSWILALWFMYVQGVGLVLGTAQDLDVAEEIWQIAVDVASEHEELSEEIARIVRENGKKALQLVSGSRYKVKAANRRGGRGLTGDVILLDELREHTSWDAWSAITKTALTRTDALVLALSNAGDVTSVVLRHLRRLAHLALDDPDGIWADVDEEDFADDSGATAPEDEYDDDLGIFEWSAPPGCDVWDREAWAQACPAMNHVFADGRVALPEKNIASAARTDPEWEFRTEVLCQWSDGAIEGPFPRGQWQAGVDVASCVADPVAVSYGLDVSANRSNTHIGVAGLREDGQPHVEVVASRAGTEWPVAWFRERASAERPMRVVVQARGAPASSLIADLKTVQHLEVVECGGPDLGNATARIFDLVKASGLRHGDGTRCNDSTCKQEHDRVGLCHLPQPVLDVAAGAAVPKILTDGGMAWDRVRSPVDAAPLVSVTWAVWDLYQPNAVDEPPPSAYEDSGLLVV